MAFVDDSPTEPSRGLLDDWNRSAVETEAYTPFPGAPPSDHESVVGSEADDVDTSGWFSWMLAFGAGVSGLLFGYDTGVISATLVGIGSDLTGLPLTALQMGLITSCTSLCAFAINPITGVLSDRLGRWWMIVIANIFFIVGSCIQAVATSVTTMIVGRCLVGVAVGGASFVVPLYISELAPAQYRGRLVMISSLFITGGQMIAYTAGWLLSTTPGGWRILVGIGAVPALLQLLFTAWMPETPRWLVSAGRLDQARRVLSQVSNTDEMSPEVDRVMRKIDIELTREDKDVAGLLIGSSQPTRPTAAGSSWARLKVQMGELTRPGASRRALTIACLLQGLQQLCGFNSFMYFSATIFSLVGFDSPTLASLAVAVTNFVFTLVAFSAIDRIGRRKILVWSIPVMVVALTGCAVAFSHIRLVFAYDEPSRTVNNGTFWPVLVLTSLVLYVAGYAIGLGNVPWQQSELFPLSVRSVGSSTATAVNWASNFVVGMTFLPMLHLLSGPVTFGLYAAVCVVGWILIWRIYPETAGCSLEDVNDLLRHSWGVSESVEKFHRRRRQLARTVG